MQQHLLIHWRSLRIRPKLPLPLLRHSLRTLELDNRIDFAIMRSDNSTLRTVALYLVKSAEHDDARC